MLPQFHKMTWKMTNGPICVTVAADTKEVYQNYLHGYYISSITLKNVFVCFIWSFGLSVSFNKITYYYFERMVSAELI